MYQTLIIPQTKMNFSDVRVPYAARRVKRSDMATLLTEPCRPMAGDLVLARIDGIGQHGHLELAAGRRSRLHVGDTVVLVYGNRYAPDQFEAEVPASLAPCHLVAAGGIAAEMLSRKSNVKAATRITPLGLVGDADGWRINVGRYALAAPRPVGHRPPVIAVLGTSMNAGKTESATQLIKGLARGGWRVGAAKVTGTGAPGDTGNFVDAGAMRVLDFVDAGLATTYLAPLEQIERVLVTLLDTLAHDGAEVIVIEIADGLLQRETRALIESTLFRARVDAVLFAAGDAMGAVAGVQMLRELGLPVRASTGCLTASPLAMREAAAGHGLPVLNLAALSASDIGARLGLQRESLAAAA